MENRQVSRKIAPKMGKHMVLRPSYNFCENKKFNLKILKCVTLHTVILAIFSSYFVTYDSNFLKCFLILKLFNKKKFFIPFFLSKFYESRIKKYVMILTVDICPMPGS